MKPILSILARLLVLTAGLFADLTFTPTALAAAPFDPGLPFDTIAFFHEPNGKITFSRVIVQKTVPAFDGINDPETKEIRTTLYGTPAAGNADVGETRLFLHGQRVSDAELAAWTAKTVNAKVKYHTREDGGKSFYFSGGEPAYTGLTTVGAPSGCPGGVCPTSSTSPSYYLPAPTYYPSCPNGNCPRR